jgi:hypothetical protein
VTGLCFGKSRVLFMAGTKEFSGSSSNTLLPVRQYVVMARCGTLSFPSAA